eukprot:m.311345 g.311345  ORF g.311345 m.311345 type:complete len:687 (+) comp27446_c1_seq1:1217-3277(+)
MAKGVLPGVWLACAVAAAGATSNRGLERRVVYGTDDRHEEAAAGTFWQSIGKSTVMLVRRTSLSENADGTWRLLTTAVHGTAPGGTTQGPSCPAVPFATQKTAGFCSGTLISATMVATAGHCITSQATCDTSAVIFNAIDTVIAGANVASGALPANTVFNCSSQVAGTLSDAWTTRANSYVLGYGGRSIDWKAFSLVGTVPTIVASPVTVKTSFVTLGENVMMIGHPSGLPRKYAGAQVAKVWSQSPDGSYRWVSNLDSFAGNSGSGVFDAAGELVGILVAGATDFVVTAGCVSVNICPNSSVATCQNFMGANSGSASADCINANGDGCQGETVTGTNVLSSALVSESGCSGARPCLNGGTCNATNLCECPAGFTGPNCIQTLGTAFCNGATGTGWLTCPLIVNGVTLANRVSSASGLRCGTSATGNTTVSGAQYTGQSSPEVFFGLNLTETTTVTVDTCGSSFDTLIHVWNQSTLTAFASDHTSPGALAINDDIGLSTGFSCTGTTRSGLTIALAPGVYVVQVEGFAAAEGAYSVNMACTCGGTCDTAFAAPYTFSSSTKTCDDLSISDTTTCFDACTVVVPATYGTTRTITSAEFGEAPFFKHKVCHCTTTLTATGTLALEDTLCENTPDFGALIAIIVVGCLLCCFGCAAVYYVFVISPRMRSRRTAGTQDQDRPNWGQSHKI